MAPSSYSLPIRRACFAKPCHQRRPVPTHRGRREVRRFRVAEARDDDRRRRDLGRSRSAALKQRYCARHKVSPREHWFSVSFRRVQKHGGSRRGPLVPECQPQGRGYGRTLMTGTRSRFGHVADRADGRLPRANSWVSARAPRLVRSSIALLLSSAPLAYSSDRSIRLERSATISSSVIG